VLVEGGVERSGCTSGVNHPATSSCTLLYSHCGGRMYAPVSKVLRRVRRRRLKLTSGGERARSGAADRQRPR
jgi:hypothetical protein